MTGVAPSKLSTTKYLPSVVPPCINTSFCNLISPVPFGSIVKSSSVPVVIVSRSFNTNWLFDLSTLKYCPSVILPISTVVSLASITTSLELVDPVPPAGIKLTVIFTALSFELEASSMAFASIEPEALAALPPNAVPSWLLKYTPPHLSPVFMADGEVSVPLADLNAKAAFGKFSCDGTPNLLYSGLAPPKVTMSTCGHSCLSPLVMIRPVVE